MKSRNIGLSLPAATMLMATLTPATSAFADPAPSQAQSKAPVRVSATRTYAFAPGAVYAVQTSPGRITDIALQPGETLGAVASGDTARWVIGDATSGSGDARRSHVLIKPAAPGLSTNLVITTDRRAYHLNVSSAADGAMISVTWSYPQDALLALDRSTPMASAASLPARGIRVEDLRFNYAVIGDKPPWRPIRAFDDGRRTYIEFPAAIVVGEVPPLFLVGESGAAQLVNYRLRGRFYIVDRLFDVAELRLGTRKPQVVRIERMDTNAEPSGARSEP